MNRITFNRALNVLWEIVLPIVSVVALVWLVLAYAVAPARGGIMAWNDPVPQGISQRQLAILDGYYATATQSIAEKMAAAVRGIKAEPESGKHAFAQARLRVLQSDIKRITADLKARSNATLGASLAASAAQGAAQAEDQVAALTASRGGRKPGGPQAAGLSAGFAGIDSGAIEVIARDSAVRLGAAIDQHGQRAVTVFRTLSKDATRIALVSEPAVNHAIAMGLIHGDPRITNRAVRELFRGSGEENSEEALSFRRLGNRQIEVGGWTGTVREYSSMVAVTRTREATVTARHERLGALGIGLVQITGRRSLNFCTRFLGLVCALTPSASEGGRYPLLSSLPGGKPPFHPRCSKGTAAYIADLASDARAKQHDHAKRQYEEAVKTGTLTRNLGREKAA